uniref:Galectin n=1 Tax=Sinocyclocheilus grahami TaxID=75366 RepID=A0A672SKS0_SINGR
MPRLLITIVGEPVPGGNRFHVDFVREHDVVFHFNPRFHENTIVRNTQLGGCWGPEEREGGFPFVQVVANLYEFLSSAEHKRRYFGMWVTKQFLVPIDFHSIFFILE